MIAITPVRKIAKANTSARLYLYWLCASIPSKITRTVQQFVQVNSKEIKLPNTYPLRRESTREMAITYVQVRPISCNHTSRNEEFRIHWGGIFMINIRCRIHANFIYDCPIVLKFDRGACQISKWHNIFNRRSHVAAFSYLRLINHMYTVGLVSHLCVSQGFRRRMPKFSKYIVTK